MGDIAPADEIISRDRLKEKQTIAELSWRPAILRQEGTWPKIWKVEWFSDRFSNILFCYQPPIRRSLFNPVLAQAPVKR
jgi:hypothetical protein